MQVLLASRCQLSFADVVCRALNVYGLAVAGPFYLYCAAVHVHAYRALGEAQSECCDCDCARS